MITAILIITLVSLAINVICFVLLKWNQLYYWDSLTTRQNHVSNELIEIGMTVRAIDEKIEDSTVYKTRIKQEDETNI
tara:strand:- start:6727 stop:6960 length:234 start_codon:yes stop_codon:yes gene_type:complete